MLFFGTDFLDFLGLVLPCVVLSCLSLPCLAVAFDTGGGANLAGVVPDILTYSARISACEKGKQPERALELFKAMQ